MNTPCCNQRQNGTAPSGPASRQRPGLLNLLLAGLLLVGLGVMPSTVWATCWFTSGSATTVTFNAGTITLTPSTQLNSVLWTSNAATPANPPQLNCDGNTSGGIVNTIAGSPTGGDNTLFPTGIPGISYRLLHPDASKLLAAYPNNTVGSGNSTYSITTNLQLVYTGPFLPPNNSTLTGQLSQWKIDVCSGYVIGGQCYTGFFQPAPVSPQPVEIFNIQATILIQVPTCNVDPGSVSKTVTLPNVTTSQFTGQGSTAGNTPFNLHLINCPSNRGVFITLDSSSAQPGVNGVIAPSGAGYASGVGVQILQGSTPVTFGTTFQTGTISGSTYDINLNARYYQTGTPISGGTVKAVATYTLNYQ
ncbi:fimbrial protein [Rhodanobacter sp. 115]|jgi:type 1 fimbria pilin|uniref:fimbrial protein n=1 Tax=Rhodanobacter sp. FW021-MT20 TaxID=1162282 RepID=UPI0034E3EC4B